VTTTPRTGIPPRVALVLGGGGLKGFAHIGALRALEERGVRPSLIAGTSIGALIAAAYVRGLTVAQMEVRALSLRKPDLFRVDHVSMVVKRMLSPSLYLEQPLQTIVDSLAPEGTFRDLSIPLLVNTVDLERGAQVTWGLPGLQDVRVTDAVYASCALPGFFPPRVIDGRTCVDGGVMENTPAMMVSRHVDAVIAVDVGSTSLIAARRVREKGFASIFMRSAQLMMRSLQQMQLTSWHGPPLLLVRPAVWQFNWFSFAHTREMIDAGYAAACEALDGVGDTLYGAGGVYPRRNVELTVDRERCTGCGICATLAPSIMQMDDGGKATAVGGPHEWSRADGAFVPECPVQAIAVEVIDGDGRRHRTMEHKVLGE
jgi:NTE family protein